MMKIHTLLIILFLYNNLISQEIEKNILDISTQICDCTKEIDSELNDKLLANCFNEIYTENKNVMNSLLIKIGEKYPNKSEIEKKGIIGNLINQNIGLNCQIIGDYISKKTTRLNDSKLLQKISNEICNDIGEKFNSSSLMNYENVDPIFGKYFEKYYSDLKEEYNKEGKKIGEFGKDLVPILMRNCLLYREWTVRMTSKE